MIQSDIRLTKNGLLFPGQGAQYPGMGKDFFSQFQIARHTFQEADDILKLSLSKIIFDGSEDTLKQTDYSQLGIFVTSIAIFRTLKEIEDPSLWTPTVCAGLSLGEYTALTVADWMTYENALPLIYKRATFMKKCCESSPGTMAVVIGLNGPEVFRIVSDLHLPKDLWVANYNCPGQIVISGTQKGIEQGTTSLLKGGAKKIIPLQVQGAFHSGLMKEAEDHLIPHLQNIPLSQGICPLISNVTGTLVSDRETIRSNLMRQITQSVLWEKSILTMNQLVDRYFEIGPGTTLATINKRIEGTHPTRSIGKVTP